LLVDLLITEEQKIDETTKELVSTLNLLLIVSLQHGLATRGKSYPGADYKRIVSAIGCVQ
jgi:hypothetical protein